MAIPTFGTIKEIYLTSLYFFMKLLIVRHGQSEDDVLDAYGGWSDYPLTDTGRSQIQASAKKIKEFGMKFDALLTSPLKRAVETGEIIANELGMKPEVFEYIKERNTYGLMCGMVKAEAKKKYPWLVEAYENDEYVDGSEREEDIKNRVKKAFELIKEMGKENVIIITHGVFMKFFFPEVFKKKLVNKEDGGFVLLGINDTGSCEIIKQDGIELGDI